MIIATRDRRKQLDFGAIFERLGRNYIYVLTGLPIAIFSFSLLVSLTVVALVTLVIGIGLVLLPFTLLMASAFATVSRRRLRAWGLSSEPARYRPTTPGIAGRLHLITDPRRWLDLVFEGFIAFPLRLTTFVLAVIWTAVGLGGVTHFFWSLFIPGDRSVIQLLRLLDPSIIPLSSAGQYFLDAGLWFLVGLAFVVTLPQVIQALAKLDARLTAALLSPKQSPPQQGQQHSSPASENKAQLITETAIGTTAWSMTGAVFAAVVLVAVGWPVVASIYALNAAVVMVLVVLHCGAIVLTLYWGWVGLGLAVAASAGLILATASVGVSVWPWPVTVLLTQCAVLIVAGLARPWYYAVSGWCAGVIVTIAVLFREAPELPSGALANSIAFAAISGVVVAGATLSRMWIQHTGRLRAAEQTSALQDRRSKELAERNRIARELHDVVAHSMSVISVQAATAQYRNPGIDEVSRREFDEIANSSRQALAEMRMLLSILRNEDDAPTAPTPGLEDIDALIEATRASGTVIRYRGFAPSHKDRLTETAPATALAAYRIVQEALSNALRHSPGSTVEVELDVTTDADTSDWVHISVSNSSRIDQTSSPVPGAGLGLVGIRERTTAVGGNCRFGPTPDGGFAIEAHLPL